MATDLPKLEAWLAEAEDCLHRLMLGQQEVTLSHSVVGNNAVTFTASDPDKLEAYIGRLQERIARARGRGRRAFWIS